MTQRCPECDAPSASGVYTCTVCGCSLVGASNPYQTPATQLTAPPPGYVDLNEVKRKVNPVAITLLCISILAAVGYSLALFGGIIEFFQSGWASDDYITAGFIVVGILLQLFVTAGSIAMLKLRSHTFCVVCSVLAFLTCCLPQMGIAVWAIVTLMNPMVKAGFSLRK